MRHGNDHRLWRWAGDALDRLSGRREMRMRIEWLMTELHEVSVERDESDRAVLLAERRIDAQDREIRALRLAVDAPLYEPWSNVEPLLPPRESPGTGELTDTEAPVTPCVRCSQPHGVGECCAGEIEEAA